MTPPVSKGATRLLSEPEAWREVARRIEVRGLRASGLCYEVTCAVGGDWDPREPLLVSADIAAAMRLRITGHLMGAGYIIDPCDDFEPGEREDVRILAALFLALEAEDDQ